MPTAETIKIIRLLREVNDRNILVWREDNELKVKFRKDGQVDQRLIQELKTNKEPILNYFRNAEANKIVKASLAKAIASPCQPLAKQADYEAMHQQKKEYLRYLISGRNTSHLRFAIRFKDLQQAVLERVLDTILQRHENLRTTLAIIDGRVRQVVHAYERDAYPIEYIDLRNRAMSEITDEVNKRLGDISFDFETRPLVNIKVIRVPQDVNVLIFVMHHAISDGGSIDVLKKEITLLYEAYGKDQSNPLLPLRLQYKDYTAWLNNLLDSPEGKEGRLQYEERILDSLARDKVQYKVLHGQGISYREELEKELRAVPGSNDSLVYQDAFGAIVTLSPATGASYTMFIDERSATRLKALSLACNASLFVTFIAGFSILFSDEHGNKNIRVSIPFSTRVSKEFEQIVGWLTHNLIVCIDVDDEMHVEEFVPYVNNVVWESADFRFYPHEQIMGSLDLPLNALAPLYINLLRTGEHTIRDFRPYHSDKGSGVMDLKCIVNECRNGMSIQLHYNTGRYPKEKIECLGRRYAAILDSMAAKDGRPLKKF